MYIMSLDVTLTAKKERLAIGGLTGGGSEDEGRLEDRAVKRAVQGA